MNPDAGIQRGSDAVAELDLRGRDRSGRSSRAGVARVLRAEGVTGRRGKPMSCPVAQFLYRRTGEIWFVQGHWARPDRVVTPEQRAEQRSGGVETFVGLPTSVQAFVRGFDRGELAADLVAPLVGAS